MEVLSVASEAAPLVKTGGLADVVGALPHALAEHGVNVRTLVPGYRQVIGANGGAEAVKHYRDLFGGPATVRLAQLGGLRLYILDAPHLFDRPGGPYADQGGRDWPDNWRRFAALAQVGADIAAGVLEHWRPDLVHAHDWQAGLTPAYIRFGDIAVPSVMTIHNLAFQGQFDAGIFPQLGLPASAMGIDGVEYYGGVGYLKAGLQSAVAITTVSPTYAREITHQQVRHGARRAACGARCRPARDPQRHRHEALGPRDRSASRRDLFGTHSDGARHQQAGAADALRARR